MDTRYRDVTAGQAFNPIQTEKPLILDVRTPGEHYGRFSYFVNAINGIDKCIGGTVQAGTGRTRYDDIWFFCVSEQVLILLRVICLSGIFYTAQTKWSWYGYFSLNENKGQICISQFWNS